MKHVTANTFKVVAVLVFCMGMSSVRAVFNRDSFVLALSCADSKGVFNGSLTRLLSGMDRSVCALHDERRLDPADPKHRALDTIALHWEGVVFRKLREVGHDGIPHRDKTFYVTPYDLELCCDRDFTDGLVASLVKQPDVMTRQSFLSRCLKWANNDRALVISQLLLFLVAHKPRFNGRTFSFKDEQGHGEQLKAVLEACGPGSDGEAPARKIIVEVIDDMLVEVRAALLSYADILAEFRYQFVGRNEFYSPPGKDKWPSEEHFLAHVDALEKNQARWLSSRNAFCLATYATMLPRLYAGLSALIGKSALSFVETVAPVEGVGAGAPVALPPSPRISRSVTGNNYFSDDLSEVLPVTGSGAGTNVSDLPDPVPFGGFAQPDELAYVERLFAGLLDDELRDVLDESKNPGEKRDIVMIRMLENFKAVKDFSCRADCGEPRTIYGTMIKGMDRAMLTDYRAGVALLGVFSRDGGERRAAAGAVGKDFVRKTLMRVRSIVRRRLKNK